MRSLGKNVAKAICYCNSMPFMLGLGGARLRGESVETVPIFEQHLAVQFDESLHQRTIAEIEKLVPPSPPAAYAKLPLLLHSRRDDLAGERLNPA